MDRFDFNISHVPGKHLCIVDTLSKSPVSKVGPNSVAFGNEVESFVEAVVTTFQLVSEAFKLIAMFKQKTPSVLL